MNRASTYILTLSLAVPMAGAWPAQADDAYPTTRQTTQQRSETDKPDKHLQANKELSASLTKANELLGKAVKNDQGESLGQIQDIVIDQGEGRIVYAVLSFGGFLGFGDKYFAIPWEAIRQSEERQVVMLNIPKQNLKESQGFDKNNWPDMANAQWNAGVHQQYGYEPYWQRNQADQMRNQRMQGDRANQPADQRTQADRQRDTQQSTMNRGQTQQNGAERVFRLERVSLLDNLAVKNAQGEKLGNIHDLVIDQREGRIAYVVITHGGVLGVGSNLALVPWQALKMQWEEKAFVLDTTKETLDRISFQSTRWPDMNNEQWARNLHRDFNEEPYWQVYGYAGYQDQPADTRRTAYDRLFDSNQSRDIRGTVVSSENFQPNGDQQNHRKITIRGDDGQRYVVHLGPNSYLDRHSVRFENGDQVNISASSVNYQGESVLMARQITTKDGQTLRLRDNQGNPQWHATQQPDQRTNNPQQDNQPQHDRHR